MSHSIEITQSLVHQVSRIVEEVLTDPSLFVVDVVIRGVRGSRVVEIYIDSDGDLDVETLAGLSREIGFMLDTEDIIDGRYKLNVSSPGLDRPLTQARQYKKNVGRSLKITYETDVGKAVVTGELLKSTEEYIEIALPNGQTKQLALENIIESKIVLPW